MNNQEVQVFVDKCTDKVISLLSDEILHAISIYLKDNGIDAEYQIIGQQIKIAKFPTIIERHGPDKIIIKDTYRRRSYSPILPIILQLEDPQLLDKIVNYIITTTGTISHIRP